MAVSLATHPARLAARAAGQKTYDPGCLCSASHQSPRYVNSGHCMECSRLKNLARATGNRRGRPTTAKQKHATAIKAAKTRFNRPAFVAALNDYKSSVEAKHRSRHLDNLIKRVVSQ